MVLCEVYNLTAGGRSHVFLHAATGHGLYSILSVVRPSCAISSISTGTSLALALRLGPSILFTQAFSRCQRCSRFSALFVASIVILRRSLWPLRQFHND